MTDFAVKVLDAGVEKFKHSAQETFDFTMVTVSGTPTNNTDVMTKAAVAGAYVPLSQKGAASGVVPLNSSSKIESTYLPSYVDDVMEYADSASFPTIGAAASVVYDTVTFTAVTRGIAGNDITLVFNGSDDLDTVVNAWNTANPTNTVGFTGQAGTYVPAAGTPTFTGGVDTLAETGKIYVALDTGKTWRYSGSIYVEIVASPGDITNEVRSTPLTGLSAATGGTVLATDTILQAFGKLENRVALNDAKVSYSASTARSDLIASSIAESDTTHAPDGASVFTALAGKSDTSHNHDGSYSPIGHDHSGVYAPVSHSHAISDVTNLQTELNGKVAVADSTITVTNDNASAITEGKAVYLKSDGHVDLARANAIATCGDVVGFVKTASIGAGLTGLMIVKPGEIVTGLTGLTVGAWYFVSVATAGEIVVASGNTYAVNTVYKPIGIAVASDKLMYLPGVSVQVAS